MEKILIIVTFITFIGGVVLANKHYQGSYRLVYLLLAFLTLLSFSTYNRINRAKQVTIEYIFFSGHYNFAYDLRQLNKRVAIDEQSLRAIREELKGVMPKISPLKEGLDKLDVKNEDKEKIRQLYLELELELSRVAIPLEYMLANGATSKLQLYQELLEELSNLGNLIHIDYPIESRGIVAYITASKSVNFEHFDEPLIKDALIRISAIVKDITKGVGN